MSYFHTQYNIKKMSIFLNGHVLTSVEKALSNLSNLIVRSTPKTFTSTSIQKKIHESESCIRQLFEYCTLGKIDECRQWMDVHSYPHPDPHPDPQPCNKKPPFSLLMPVIVTSACALAVERGHMNIVDMLFEKIEQECDASIRSCHRSRSAATNPLVIALLRTNYTSHMKKILSLMDDENNHDANTHITASQITALSHLQDDKHHKCKHHPYENVLFKAMCVFVNPEMVKLLVSIQEYRLFESQIYIPFLNVCAQVGFPSFMETIGLKADDDPLPYWFGKDDKTVEKARDDSLQIFRYLIIHVLPQRIRSFSSYYCHKNMENLLLGCIDRNQQEHVRILLMGLQSLKDKCNFIWGTVQFSWYTVVSKAYFYASTSSKDRTVIMDIMRTASSRALFDTPAFTQGWVFFDSKQKDTVVLSHHPNNLLYLFSTGMSFMDEIYRLVEVKNVKALSKLMDAIHIDVHYKNDYMLQCAVCEKHIQYHRNAMRPSDQKSDVRCQTTRSSDFSSDDQLLAELERTIVNDLQCQTTRSSDFQ